MTSSSIPVVYSYIPAVVFTGPQTKLAGDVMIYSWDFSNFLGSDSLVSAVVSGDASLTFSTPVVSKTGVNLLISGGTAGASVDVICMITTAGGESFHSVVSIAIV